MDIPNNKKSESHFPSDLAALLMPVLIALPILELSPYLWGFNSQSGSTLRIAALVLAAIGIVLLFIAHRPLFHQRRFRALGPRALDPVHRRF